MRRDCSAVSRCVCRSVYVKESRTAVLRHRAVQCSAVSRPCLRPSVIATTRATTGPYESTHLRRASRRTKVTSALETSHPLRDSIRPPQRRQFPPAGCTHRQTSEAARRRSCCSRSSSSFHHHPLPLLTRLPAWTATDAPSLPFPRSLLPAPATAWLLLLHAPPSSCCQRPRYPAPNRLPFSPPGQPSTYSTPQLPRLQEIHPPIPPFPTPPAHA